jgi:uncharacterized protein DUF1579
MPDGGAALTFMTLGFDPQKGGYVGIWIGSMTSFLWIYRGTLDRAEKILTLDTEGPNFDGEGLAKFQDIIEIKSDDYQTATLAEAWERWKLVPIYDGALSPSDVELQRSLASGLSLA